MKFLSLMIPLIIGCATLTKDGPDQFYLESYPSGAKVRVNGNFVGTTPLTVKVERDQECSIQISKDDYEPYFYEGHKVLNGAFLGNLLFGPLTPIGWSIDLIGHNQGRYNSEDMRVHLFKK